MSDMGEMYRAFNEYKKATKSDRLARSETDGWKMHSEYHFSRVIQGKRVNWWPSTAKAEIDGKMVYGEARIRKEVGKLERGE